MPPVYRTNPITGQVLEIDSADLPAFEQELAAAMATQGVTEQQQAGQPFYLSVEETRPVQEIGLGGQVGNFLYGAGKGATLNLSDELIGALFPETAKSLEAGYQQYQAENPKLALASEIAGGIGGAFAAPAATLLRAPAAVVKAAEILGAANRLGMGTGASALGGSVASGALSGYGAGEGGPLSMDRFSKAGISALFGLGGGVAGQKLGRALGEGKAGARVALEQATPEEQAFGKMVLAESPELAQPQVIKQAQAALQKTPDLMLGEAVGAPQQIIRAAQEPSGLPIQEALMQRGQERGGRLSANVAEATGIQSRKTPRELARVAKQTTKTFEKESLKRAEKSGEKMYRRLPELREQVNLRRIGKIQQQAYRAQDAFERDVVEEFGEEFYTKYVSPETSKAVKTKMQNQIINAGIGTEEAAVAKTAQMAKKRPVENALDRLAYMATSGIAKKIIRVAENKRELGLNTAGNRTLSDYKKIISYGKTLARDLNKSPDKGEFANVQSKDILEVVNKMNRVLQESVPGLKKADWVYKWSKIPSGFGGMTSDLRDVVRKLARTQETNPQAFADELLKVSPKALKRILTAAARVGDASLKEGFKRGLKAKIDEALATSDRDVLGKLFPKGERSREIFGLLFGTKNLEKLLEKQAIEQGMSAVEAKALRNSITGSVAMAKETAMEAQKSGFVTAVSKILGTPVKGPQGIVNLIASFLANETVKPTLKRDMDKILSLQGKTAIEKLGLLGPYLEQLGKGTEAAEEWQAIGGLIGTKGISALVQ